MIYVHEAFYWIKVWMNRSPVIYRITNLINGKLYIGFTVQLLCQRIFQHSRSKTLIGNAIRKYGRENFKIEVLLCGFDVKETATILEPLLIKQCNSLVPSGYNISKGGEYCTKEQREKLRNSPYKKPIIKYGIDNPMWGKRHNKETIDLLKSKRISEDHKKTLSDWNNRNSPTRGLKYDESTKTRMRELQLIAVEKSLVLNLEGLVIVLKEKPV